MIKVTCLDDGIEYWFTAKTPLEAMQKMLYTLNLSAFDRNATINKTESGMHLYIDHNDKTYAVANY